VYCIYLSYQLAVILDLKEASSWAATIFSFLNIPIGLRSTLHYEKTLSLLIHKQLNKRFEISFIQDSRDFLAKQFPLYSSY
jgi:hypothetical protein